jgi:hypothetical protein
MKLIKSLRFATALIETGVPLLRELTLVVPSTLVTVPRIGDTFDGRINVINSIQVCYLIHRINATSASQIGSCGVTEAQTFQHRPDRVN